MRYRLCLGYWVPKLGSITDKNAFTNLAFAYSPSLSEMLTAMGDGFGMLTVLGDRTYESHVRFKDQYTMVGD